MNKQRESVRKQLAKLEEANLRSSEYRERLLAELRTTMPLQPHAVRLSIRIRCCLLAQLRRKA